MKNFECKLCASNHLPSPIYSNLSDFIGSASKYDSGFYECAECRHVFLHPTLSASELKQSYEGYYTQSSAHLSKDHFMGDQRFRSLKFYYAPESGKSQLYPLLKRVMQSIPVLNFLLQRAVRFVPETNGSQATLLDIGCGNGQFLLRAQELGYQTIGIDFDSKAIKTARSLGLNVLEGSLKDIGTQRKFDVITSSHVLEHVTNPLEELHHIFRILQDDGYFYLATPNFSSAGRAVFGKYWRGLEFPRHLHIFETQQLASLLEKIGFVDVDVVYDLPQSLNILRSSFKIYQKNGKPMLGSSLYMFFRTLKQNPFKTKNLEVAVIKCRKPSSG